MNYNEYQIGNLVYYNVGVIGETFYKIIEIEQSDTTIIYTIESSDREFKSKVPKIKIPPIKLNPEILINLGFKKESEKEIYKFQEFVIVKILISNSISGSFHYYIIEQIKFYNFNQKEILDEAIIINHFHTLQNYLTERDTNIEFLLK